jgi:hypothetical protein
MTANQSKTPFYLLQYTFSDGCTYSATELVGVFSTKELAEEAKQPWEQRQTIQPNEYCGWDDITEIYVDVPVDYVGL